MIVFHKNAKYNMHMLVSLFLLILKVVFFYTFSNVIQCIVMVWLCNNYLLFDQKKKKKNRGVNTLKTCIFLFVIIFKKKKKKRKKERKKEKKINIINN